MVTNKITNVGFPYIHAGIEAVRHNIYCNLMELPIWTMTIDWQSEQGLSIHSVRILKLDSNRENSAMTWERSFPNAAHNQSRKSKINESNLWSMPAAKKKGSWRLSMCLFSWSRIQSTIGGGTLRVLFPTVVRLMIRDSITSLLMLPPGSLDQMIQRCAVLKNLYERIICGQLSLQLSWLPRQTVARSQDEVGLGTRCCKLECYGACWAVTLLLKSWYSTREWIK